MTDQQLQALQLVAWSGTIVSALVAVIVNREKLTTFLKPHRKFLLMIVGVEVVWLLYSRGWLDWLRRPTNTPIWVWLLVGCALIPLCWLTWVIRGAVLSRAIQARAQDYGPSRARITRPPPHTEYGNDAIFEVWWSWSYRRGLIYLPDLTAFCPNEKCRHRLAKRDDYERASYQHYLPISLHCPRCGFVMKFDCGLDELQRRVSDEIERRINTKEYLNALRGGDEAA
jgi:hypothetical protein